MMGVGRMILRTVCAAAATIAVCAGSVAMVAPALAVDNVDGNTDSGSSITVDDAVFEWGVNPETGGGSYFGGCNALSAGTAGDAGGSGVWTAAKTGKDGKPLYRAVDESAHAEILKPDQQGKLERVESFDARCTNRAGESIKGSTGGMKTSSGNPTYSENVVRLSDGQGTIDAATQSAHIEWKGASFTIVYYGGMTYWSIADPVLDITNGKGTLTGTASGYGADMNDPAKWTTLGKTIIHLADFATGAQSGVESGVENQIAFDMEKNTLTATPDYLGVTADAGAEAHSGQVEKTDENAAWWGSFPASWVQYNMQTGQSSYWYTTSGSVNSIQPRKVASPVAVTWGGGEPDNGGDNGGDNNGNGSGDNGSGDNGNNGGGDHGGDNGGDNGNNGNNNGNNNGGNNNGGDNGGDNGNDNNGGTESGDTVLTGVTLRWGINDETNSASYYGGCNFISAGKAGNTGSSKTWSSDFYKAKDGNVSVEKPDSSGNWVSASWDSKCLTRDGDAVKMEKRADGRSVNSETQVVLSKGAGTVKSDGSVEISWTGSFTVAYYGGMTYWSVTDPALTLDASGNGTLTATASGYGADMNDASKWLTLTPRTIHLADFKGVDVKKAASAHGFAETPEYLGVKVAASGDHGGQAAKDGTNASYWGSFPQSFVDFQVETGQSAYWYTSNSARDFAKPTLPLYVQYDSSYTVSAGDGSPAAATAAGGARSSTGGTGSGSTGTKSGSSTAKKTTGGVSGGAAAADADDMSADAGGAGDEVSTAGGAAADTMLIADNARTIALGSGSVAAATGLPLALGWFVRRRLGLDAAAELDRRLGL